MNKLILQKGLIFLFHMIHFYSCSYLESPAIMPLSNWVAGPTVQQEGPLLEQGIDHWILREDLKIDHEKIQQLPQIIVDYNRTQDYFVLPSVKEHPLHTFFPSLKKSNGRFNLNLFSLDTYSHSLKVTSFFLKDNPEHSLEEVPVELAQFFVIQFNHIIDPEYLGKQLIIKQNGKAVDFSVLIPEAESPPRSLEIKLDALPKESSHIVITWPKDLKIGPNTPSLGVPESLELTTLSPFFFQEIKVETLPDDPSRKALFFYFSHLPFVHRNMDLIQIFIDGKILNSALSYSQTKRALYTPLTEGKPGSKIKVVLSNNIYDLYNRNIINPGVYSLSLGQHSMINTLPTGGDFLLPRHSLDQFWFRHQGLDSLSLQVEPIFTDNPPQKPWRRVIPLEKEGIYNYYQQSLQILDFFPESNLLGIYNISWFSSFSQFGSKQFSFGRYNLEITDVGVLGLIGFNKIFLYINSLESGQPLVGARVVLLGKDDSFFLGYTDSAGLLEMDFEPLSLQRFISNEQQALLEVSYGLDVSKVQLKDFTEESTSQNTRKNLLKAGELEHRVWIALGKEKYHSSENLHFMGYHWEQNWEGFRPSLSRSPFVQIVSSTSEVLYKIPTQRSYSGGFEGSIPLQSFPPGVYEIQYGNGSTILKRIQFFLDNDPVDPPQFQIGNPFKEGEKLVDVMIFDHKNRNTLFFPARSWGNIHLEKSREKPLNFSIKIFKNDDPETLHWEKNILMETNEYTIPFPFGASGEYLLKINLENSFQQWEYEKKLFVTGDEDLALDKELGNQIQIIQDITKPSFSEKARILIRTPISQGKYLVSIQREEIISEEIIELQGSHHLLEIPLKSSYWPHFYLNIQFLNEKKQPFPISGQSRIDLNTDEFKLDLEVFPLRPAFLPNSMGGFFIYSTHKGYPLEKVEISGFITPKKENSIQNFGDDLFQTFYNPVQFPLSVLQIGNRHNHWNREVLKNNRTINVNQNDKNEAIELQGPLLSHGKFFSAYGSNKDGWAYIPYEMPEIPGRYRMNVLGIHESRVGGALFDFSVREKVEYQFPEKQSFRQGDQPLFEIEILNTQDAPSDVGIGHLMADHSIYPQSMTLRIPAQTRHQHQFLSSPLKVGTHKLHSPIKSDLSQKSLTREITVLPLSNVDQLPIHFLIGDDLHSFWDNIIVPKRLLKNLKEGSLFYFSSLNQYKKYLFSEYGEKLLFYQKEIKPLIKLLFRLSSLRQNLEPWVPEIEELIQQSYVIAQESSFSPPAAVLLGQISYFLRARDSWKILRETKILPSLSRYLTASKYAQDFSLWKLWASFLLLEEETYSSKAELFLKDLPQDQMEDTSKHILETWINLNESIIFTDDNIPLFFGKRTNLPEAFFLYHYFQEKPRVAKNLTDEKKLFDGENPVSNYLPFKEMDEGIQLSALQNLFGDQSSVILKNVQRTLFNEKSGWGMILFENFLGPQKIKNSPVLLSNTWWHKDQLLEDFNLIKGETYRIILQIKNSTPIYDALFQFSLPSAFDLKKIQSIPLDLTLDYVQPQPNEFLFSWEDLAPQEILLSLEVEAKISGHFIEPKPMLWSAFEPEQKYTGQTRIVSVINSSYREKD